MIMNHHRQKQPLQAAVFYMYLLTRNPQKMYDKSAMIRLRSKTKYTSFGNGNAAV